MAVSVAHVGAAAEPDHQEKSADKECERDDGVE
jgi:hypothetical protein